MPDDRTTITELGTALGTLPFPDARVAIAERPAELRVETTVWETLDAIVRSGRYADELRGAFANGKAFLEAPDGLRGRLPQTIEWTGGRRAPGDEVAPIDLRIDHVFLVSCKYESDIVANVSPGRLFDGLLATTGAWERTDWYATVAPGELAALYRACLDATGLDDLPHDAASCSREELQRLRTALQGRTYPDAGSQAAYRELCRVVSEASAAKWRDSLESSGVATEVVLWRLLRIGSAPYYVLGHDRRTGAPARLRISSPWDWRDRFELEGAAVQAASAGQPRVDWAFTCRDREDDRCRTVEGHVEIRWSHGRFAQPPEAKVYLDTPMAQLPGYHLLDGGEDPQLALWPATS